LPSRNRNKKKKSGRPRMNDRKAMNAIFYILRTGCQWKALPRSLGASSTVHDRQIDFKSGERLVYSNVCGLIVYCYTIKR
jgi:transposase